MKRLSSINEWRNIIVWSFIFLVVSCQFKENSKLDNSTFTVEEAVIRETITEHYKALSDFPKTRDLQSVLKFYDEDYIEINNGKWGTLQEKKEFLSNLEEIINLGSPIGISAKVMNIKVYVNGNIGWATYDFVFKTGIAGEALEEMRGKCTGIYKKKDTTWLAQHEHCSTL